MGLADATAMNAIAVVMKKLRSPGSAADCLSLSSSLICSHYYRVTAAFASDYCH